MNREDAELLSKEAFVYDGYDVKSVQMRKDRMDTKFWSLGEEWERNFAQLQNMPPRHCFIKHKIQGGMLPLETASIEPAWQALKMSPEEYVAYVATLPFGQKYLLKRATLTQLQAAQTQTAQPTQEPQTTKPSQAAPQKAKPQEVKPQLDEQQQAFLEFVMANPETALTAVYKGIAVSVRRGNDIRDSLKAQGFIAEIETRLGTGGRRTHFFIPTFTAFDLLGKEPPAGRGGTIHRRIQHLIEMGAAANGFTAKCEYDLGNGGIVDVHLEKGEYRVAVEIAVASRPSREIALSKIAWPLGTTAFLMFLPMKKCNRKRKKR
jgi:hypothetical protein